MAKTVELLYKNGALIDVWESRKGEPRQWGSDETPENGYMVLRIYGTKKDLPGYLKEHGYGISRMKIDESKMSTEELALCKDVKRFEHQNHQIKHTITIERLEKICIDNQDQWDAERF